MSNSTRLALLDVRGPLDDLIGKLTSENGSEWLAAFNRFLRKENPWDEVEKRTHPRKILSEPRKILLPGRTTAFNPNEFFRTRSGLYVSGAFEARILSVAECVSSLPAQQITSLDHGGEEISSNPANDLIFRSTPFCSLLAHMIELQPNGEKGDLLTTLHHANVFYVYGRESLVFWANVRYRSDSGVWVVDASFYEESQWCGAPGRVFWATADA